MSQTWPGISLPAPILDGSLWESDKDEGKMTGLKAEAPLRWPLQWPRWEVTKKKKRCFWAWHGKGAENQIGGTVIMEVGEMIDRWVKDDLQISSMDEWTRCCYELRETKIGFRNANIKFSFRHAVTLGTYRVCGWSKALAVTGTVIKNTRGLYHHRLWG